MHDNRKRIRLSRKDRPDNVFALWTHVHRTVGVIIWKAITYGSRLHLLLTQDNITAVCYVSNVLQFTLLP